MDWLIPVLIIGYSLFQWWTNLQKQLRERERQQRGETVQAEPAPSDEWNELLEALGQKPSTSPPAPPKVFIPPPLPVQPAVIIPEETESEGPAWSQHVDEHKFRSSFEEREDILAKKESELQQLTRQLETLAQQTQRLEQAKVAKPADAFDLPTARLAVRMLKDSKTLRNAMVMKEILDPPLALRLEPTT